MNIEIIATAMAATPISRIVAGNEYVGSAITWGELVVGEGKTEGGILDVWVGSTVSCCVGERRRYTWCWCWCWDWCKLCS